MSRRLLWLSVAVALAALAVTAIVAVVAGSYGDTFWRTIGTVIMLFVGGATTLAGIELAHRRQLLPLGWVAVVVAPACTVTLLIADWKHDVSTTYGRGLVTAGVILLATLAVTTLRLVVDLQTPATFVLFTGVALCSAALVALGVPLIWMDDAPDGAVKAVLVLVVLVVLGYAATPVVQRATHRH